LISAAAAICIAPTRKKTLAIDKHHRRIMTSSCWRI
jgi:hypothetical protein